METSDQNIKDKNTGLTKEQAEEVSNKRLKKFQSLKEEALMLARMNKNPDKASPALVYSDPEIRAGVAKDYDLMESDLHNAPVDTIAAIKYLRDKQKRGEKVAAPIDYNSVSFLGE